MSLPETILASSPLAYWPCDDGTGTGLADASGNSRPMTGLAGATWGTTRLLAGSSPGSVFTGGNLFTAASATWNQITGPFTICMVTSWNAVSADANLSKGVSNGYGLARFDVSATDYVRLRTYNTGVVSTTELNANTLLRDNPHTAMLVGTYDGSVGKVYVDGVLRAGPTALTAPTTGTDALTLDVSQPTSDVALWGRALTDSEVSNLWAQANTPPIVSGGDVAQSWGDNPNAVDIGATLTPASGPAIDLDLISGEIVWDAGDTWRTSGSIDVPFTLDTWQLVKDFSASRVRVSVGAVQPNGSVVPFPAAGPLVIRRAAVTRPEDRITLTLASEASLVDDLRFTADTPYPAGDASTKIQALITAALPLATFDVQGNGPGLAAESNAGTSRWEAVEAVADYGALEVWQDVDGRFVIRPQPVGSSIPVDSLAVGAGGNIIQSFSDFDRDTFANAYAVRSAWIDANGQTNYAYGIVYNTDATTGTQWDGPAGNRVQTDAMTVKLTDAEAQQIAARRLRRALGHGRGVRVTCPLRPWLFPGDPISVELPTGGVQIHTVQRVAHDLAGLTTTIDTRLLPE